MVPIQTSRLSDIVSDVPIRPRAAGLDRVVASFDRLMHALMATHAPELHAIDLTMSQAKALYLDDRSPSACSSPAG